MSSREKSRYDDIASRFTKIFGRELNAGEIHVIREYFGDGFDPRFRTTEVLVLEHLSRELWRHVSDFCPVGMSTPIGKMEVVLISHFDVDATLRLFVASIFVDCLETEMELLLKDHRCYRSWYVRDAVTDFFEKKRHLEIVKPLKKVA